MYRKILNTSSSEGLPIVATTVTSGIMMFGCVTSQILSSGEMVYKDIWGDGLQGN